MKKGMPTSGPVSSTEPGPTLDHQVSPAGAGFDPGSSRGDAEVSMMREPPGLVLVDYSSIEIGAVTKHTTMITSTAATTDLCVPLWTGVELAGCVLEHRRCALVPDVLLRLEDYGRKQKRRRRRRRKAYDPESYGL